MRPTSMRRPAWQVWVPLLMMVCGLVLLAAVNLFGAWINRLWILSLGIFGLAWVLAIVLGAAAVAMLWAARGTKAGVPLLVAGLLAVVTIAVVDWTPVFANGYFRAYRDDFASVAALARADELDDGEMLPPRLRHLSFDERATISGAFEGHQSALFLPVWAGIPDGAAGFAYFDEIPSDTSFDCNGDPCHARWSLGDGWYWLQPG